MYIVVAGAEKRSVGGYCDACDGDVFLGDELVRAFVLAQVPDPHVAAPVTADELALVWVDDDVVDGVAVGVVPLHGGCACVPYLNCSIF